MDHNKGRVGNEDTTCFHRSSGQLFKNKQSLPQKSRFRSHINHPLRVMYGIFKFFKNNPAKPTSIVEHRGINSVSEHIQVAFGI